MSAALLALGIAPPPAVDLTISGVDLAAFGAVVARWDGDLAVTATPAPIVTAPWAIAGVASGAPATAPDRVLSIECTVVAATATARDLAVSQLLAHAAGVASQAPAGSGDTGPLVPARGAASGAVVIARPSRGLRFTGLLDGTQTRVARLDPGRGGTTGLVGASVTLVFRCPDPMAYDIDELTLTIFSAGIFRCPLGTAPVAPLCRRAGPWTTWETELWDGRGIADVRFRVGRCVIQAPSGAVAAGEAVEVDHARQTVVHVSAAGVRTPRAQWLALGDFLVLDPALRGTLGEPGFLIDSSAGEPMTVRYRRAWRSA